jgi:hypothetical protein
LFDPAEEQFHAVGWYTFTFPELVHF